MLKLSLWKRHQEINAPTKESLEKCQNFLNQFEKKVQFILKENQNEKIIRIPIDVPCSKYVKEKLRKEDIDFVHQSSIPEYDESEMVIIFGKGSKPNIIFS